MKKVYLTTLLLLSFVIGSQAQLFNEGGLSVQGGIGFGGGYAASGLNRSVPPVHISAEFGISDKIGIGGLVGYTSAESATIPFFGGTYKYSYTIVGGRGMYHFVNNDKLDLYAGAMLGFNVASAKYTGSSNNAPAAVSNGGLVFGFLGGARLGFSDSFYGFAEAGYSIAYLSVGLGIAL